MKKVAKENRSTRYYITFVVAILYIYILNIVKGHT